MSHTEPMKYLFSALMKYAFRISTLSTHVFSTLIYLFCVLTFMCYLSQIPTPTKH